MTCKKSLLLLALLFPLSWGFSVSAGPAESDMIKSLAEMNQKLERTLLMRDSQLSNAENKLSEVSKRLETLEALLESMQTENEKQLTENAKIQLLWQNHEIYVNELKTSLQAKENEALISEIVAGILGVGWLVDRAFVR